MDMPNVVSVDKQVGHLQTQGGPSIEAKWAWTLIIDFCPHNSEKTNVCWFLTDEWKNEWMSEWMKFTILLLYDFETGSHSMALDDLELIG